MFIVQRKTPGKDRWCVILCRSERQGKKVHQKRIKYFGMAHGKDELEALVKKAKLELKTLQNTPTLQKKISSTTDPCNGTLLGDVVEMSRVTEGFHTVMGPCFDKLGLSSLLTKTRYQQLRDVVMARIAQPASKLHTSKILQSTFNKELSVDQIYHLMDTLVDLEDPIKLKVFKTTQKRLKDQPVDLLLFDVTTLYFESQESDELREIGYSKDHKIGEVQVVLALATTSNGSPIGYHLFPGNTAEVSTLLECIKKWREDFKITNTIVVADRAMLSEKNLTLMESEGLTYIVAAKLRALPNQLKQKILSQNQQVCKKESQEHICIQEHDHQGRRLVVSYSHSRASKDIKDREKLIQRLRSKLNISENPQTLITNRGYLKFVDEKTQGKIGLNEEKITSDKQWDGLHGVITNDKTSKAIDLLHRYRNLWVIEESFRINKHTLAMRPIYHFSPKRIRAHVLICYLAFTVTRYVHQDVNIFEQRISIENLREALASVEVSILKNESEGTVFTLPAPLTKEANMIYRALGLTQSLRPVSRSFNA